MLFHKMGFIGFFSLLKNVGIRLVTRLLPNSFRSLLYKMLIRGEIAFYLHSLFHPQNKHFFHFVAITVAWYLTLIFESKMGCSP